MLWPRSLHLVRLSQEASGAWRRRHRCLGWCSDNALEFVPLDWIGSRRLSRSMVSMRKLLALDHPTDTASVPADCRWAEPLVPLHGLRVQSDPDSHVPLRPPGLMHIHRFSPHQSQQLHPINCRLTTPLISHRQTERYRDRLTEGQTETNGHCKATSRKQNQLSANDSQLRLNSV